MTRKGLRRLEVWLPDNHPIWQYPPGHRSARAREWLDLALRLEERLKNLEVKLDALAIKNDAGSNSPDAARNPQLDPGLFLEI